MENVENFDELKNKIPYQLQKDGFGFVKLLPNSKEPFEKDWQKKPYPHTAIQSWINNGKNYGVLGGYGGLIIVDTDTPEMADFVRNTLPRTFTVKSPKKGYHYYFICPETNAEMSKNLEKGGVHQGEIRSFGRQTVGPNSIHPDTGTSYIVETDTDIAQIGGEELLSLLAEYLPKGIQNIDDVAPAFTTLVDRYGAPYYFDKNNHLSSVNQTFWAGLHSEEHIQLYEPDEKIFYRYDEKTGLYQEISKHAIIHEITDRMLSVSREKSLPALETKRTMATLTYIVEQLKGLSEKRGAFHKTSNFVHLANGMLVFNENGEADLTSFSPSFNSRNCCPISFDENARCERFLNELLQPAVSNEDAILIQKYVGLCLLGNNLAQRFLILEGMAGRGKTTLALIIQQLIGQTNVSELRTRHLSERFELYRYLKKTLLIGVDVSGNFLSEKGAQVIKGLVGGDWFNAEQKGGTGDFKMQGNYCIVITSNSRLNVRLDGDIGAWKRRLLIVRFEAPPPAKKIPHFDELLIKEEGSGILNWALCGLGMLIKDINTCGDFQLSPRQDGIVDALLAESDSLRHFLGERCMRDDSSDLTVPEIVEAYAEYCPTKGWNPKPITIIYNELEGLMLELFATAKSQSIKRDGKSVRGFRRVGFRQAEVT